MTLRQDIDLLQRPPVRWEDQLLRVEVLLVFLLIIMAIGIIADLSIMMRKKQVSQQLSALALLENQRQLNLSQLQDMLDPGKHQAERDQHITNLRKQLAIYTDQNVYKPGFSESLQDLSHLSYHGVWLTEIRLDHSEPGSIHLEGQAQSSALFSQYLAEMRNQSSAMPQKFRQVRVQQDQNQPLHFVLDSQLETSYQ